MTDDCNPDDYKRDMTLIGKPVMYCLHEDDSFPRDSYNAGNVVPGIITWGWNANTPTKLREKANLRLFLRGADGKPRDIHVTFRSSEYDSSGPEDMIPGTWRRTATDLKQVDAWIDQREAHHTSGVVDECGFAMEANVGGPPNIPDVRKNFLSEKDRNTVRAIELMGVRLLEFVSDKAVSGDEPARREALDNIQKGIFGAIEIIERKPR